MLGGAVKQGLAVELVTAKHSQPTRRPGTHGGMLFAVPGARGRVENRSRADLEGGPLVDLDEQESVEEQVDLGVGDRPFAQQCALGQVLLPVIARHEDRIGEGALGWALDGRDRHRLATASPRSVMLSRSPDPVLVPDHRAFVGEAPGAVVEVVTGEPARGGDLGCRGPVGAEGERDGGPGDGRGQLPERRMGHRPGHRRAGVPAGGLGETDPVGVDLRRRGQVGEGDAIRQAAGRLDLDVSA